MNLPPFSERRGFTLVELLAVLAILAILFALGVPEYNRYIDRANSAACAANLRAIGLAVRNYINENDGTFPIIETNPDNPIYPAEVEARPMLETLEPYGITARTLRCPSDVRARNYFGARGTSYEWRPVVDDENFMSPKIYTRRGERSVNPSRIRLVIDIDAVHNGRQNQLYGDGRVRSF
jgi:prepilin-type N-terminal cleavage/methylation domain-containing protein